MKKTKIIIVCMIILIVCVLLYLKKSSGPKTDSTQVPETHTIAYDDKLDTLDDDMGADAFNHELDHPGSRYYVANDYYNMTGDDNLHILTHFETYQQTTEYSCGCACALMVLNHYGFLDCNEMDICKIAETDTSKGTSVEGLVRFFEWMMGWNTTYNADSKKLYYNSPEECEKDFIELLDKGTPIMVDWVDWSGHWQVIIGLDQCDTESPYDDVLIMADPYDVTDHYQDGYYVVPFGRFFSMWQEGSVTEKKEPYLQPFVIATPMEI